MKHLTKIFVVLIIFIFASGNLSAQSEEHPLLVVSFQKVKMSDIEEANKIINEKMAPVLKGLVDDGLIYNWGLFNHAWGDEWNVNVWYTMKDMDAFSKFWGEFRKRMMEKQPDAWKELTAMIMEHKDNIYSIQNEYPAPPSE